MKQIEFKDIDENTWGMVIAYGKPLAGKVEKDSDGDCLIRHGIAYAYFATAAGDDWEGRRYWLFDSPIELVRDIEKVKVGMLANFDGDSLLKITEVDADAFYATLKVRRDFGSLDEWRGDSRFRFAVADAAITDITKVVVGDKAMFKGLSLPQEVTELDSRGDGQSLKVNMDLTEQEKDTIATMSAGLLPYEKWMPDSQFVSATHVEKPELPDISDGKLHVFATPNGRYVLGKTIGTVEHWRLIGGIDREDIALVRESSDFKRVHADALPLKPLVVEEAE